MGLAAIKVGSGSIVGRRVRWGLDSIGNWVPVVWVLGLDAPPCAVCVRLGGGERGINIDPEPNPFLLGCFDSWLRSGHASLICAAYCTCTCTYIPLTTRLHHPIHGNNNHRKSCSGTSETRRLTGEASQPRYS